MLFFLLVCFLDSRSEFKARHNEARLEESEGVNFSVADKVFGDNLREEKLSGVKIFFILLPENGRRLCLNMEEVLN